MPSVQTTAETPAMTPTPTPSIAPRVVIVGGGPAGLMAADVVSRAASAPHVDLFDAMPTPGRKLLMAGRGGLNITHSETRDAFDARYGNRRACIAPLLDAFGPDEVRTWMRELGIDSFVGSSGRVFPAGMKAAPLLRAWLHRLRAAGVRLHPRQRWNGIVHLPDGRYALAFSTPTGDVRVEADAVILALGGGSWARLGSDGAWVPLLERAGLPVAALRPANCGFDVRWSDHLRDRFAGQPVKNVVARCVDAAGTEHARAGEFVVTENGVEGGLIYALSAPLRDLIESNGSACLTLDLQPERSPAHVFAEVARPRGARSLASHLQSRLGLKGVKVALVHEALTRDEIADPARLAQAIKALPLTLVAPRPLDEAISSAGGVLFEALDEHLMARRLPGLFCAGEMLDWEAPTGGYLLTACLASGHAAVLGALAWLENERLVRGLI